MTACGHLRVIYGAKLGVRRGAAAAVIAGGSAHRAALSGRQAGHDGPGDLRHRPDTAVARRSWRAAWRAGFRAQGARSRHEAGCLRRHRTPRACATRRPGPHREAAQAVIPYASSIPILLCAPIFTTYRRKRGHDRCDIGTICRNFDIPGGGGGLSSGRRGWSPRSALGRRGGCGVGARRAHGHGRRRQTRCLNQRSSRASRSRRAVSFAAGSRAASIRHGRAPPRISPRSSAPR